MSKKTAPGRWRMSSSELSAFCTQIALLIESAVSLTDGLYLMAQDARTEAERGILNRMAEDIESAMPFHAVLANAGFPDYLVRMAELGQETGSLDRIMRDLASYYEKEDALSRTVKRAVTYPVVLVFMLLVVLFVLLWKVFPVFEGVYSQLGAQLSPVAKNAVSIGTVLTGAAIGLLALLVILGVLVFLLSRRKKKVLFIVNLLETIKRRSKIARMTALRRLSFVLGMTIGGGIDMLEGIKMASTVVGHTTTAAALEKCSRSVEEGKPIADALRDAGLFTGLNAQMLKVGGRSGKLDSVMSTISDTCERDVNNAVDAMLGRLEPTLVIVLCVAVGFILLSVMLPLIGMMSALG